MPGSGLEPGADVAAIVMLVQWARTKGAIRMLWVFCSRWKGANHPDTDLDVCIEVEAASARWLRTTRASWQEELATLFGVRAHLETNASATMKARVAESGALVYARDE